MSLYDDPKNVARRARAKPRGGQRQKDGSIWHPPHGCRRFRCPCGKLHEWVSPGVAKLEGVRWRPGTRAPERYRTIVCTCGQVHTR